MAFEGLADKLQDTFRHLRGKGVLTEKDIDSAMREVKLALLEADVNFKVVKKFVADVKEKAMGQDVMKSLTPAQQVVKIVKDELVDMMGGANSKLTYSPSGFTVYMMVGLQGTGKTTTCGKLANYLKQNGKKPMLCACDVYRPAAIDQLEVVGKAVNTPVFTMRESSDPVEIAKAAVDAAERKGCNVLIVDTAGRLQIDEKLMDELKQLKKNIRPHEILLVVDALTGQDAVNIASGFDEALGVDGIVMTKMDGDSRGGAALSAKSVTGKPIKFMGTGEKYDALEPFHPNPGNGRYDELDRACGEFLHRRRSSENGREASEKQVRPGRFSRTDGADQQDGRSGKNNRHDSGHFREGQAAAGLRTRRGAAEPDEGDYPVHDQSGTKRPFHSQRQPAKENCCGKRKNRHRSERAD